MAVEIEKPPEPEIRTLKLTGRVGFDSLPDQLVNKAISQGFSFNVLCVGETGIGKSTLMETLFNHPFDFSPCSHDLPEPGIKEYIHELTEGNVKLRLTIAESRGFGDQLNRDDNVKPITQYINEQHEKYLQEELNLKRSLHSYQDTRIHVCIYFIAPTGHSLKSIDLIALQALQDMVNIVPVIAKSDTITRSELQAFKAKILSEIKANHIKIYEAPTDDPTISEINSKINQVAPFAVIGSTEKAVVDGKTTRVRQYPWGSVQVENEAHCDFVRLRESILRTNMEDLIELTHKKHYEAYRRQRLIEIGYRDDDKMTLQELYEKRRDTQRKELQDKENELRKLFVTRVKEKERELKEAEHELQLKFDSLKQTEAEERKKLADQKRALEEDIAAFEKQKLMVQQAKQSGALKKKK